MPGKLRSMASSDSFRDYVIDQLSALGNTRARAMFGGIGLYAGDVFFGMIASDVLYLKVDDSNRERYESADSAPFRPYEGKPMTMPYYNVPVSVLEDADRLVKWAKLSVNVARKGKGAKRVKEQGVKGKGTKRNARRSAGPGKPRN
jgi:DNA transformation protein